MNKELQNQAWASLLADFKKEVRDVYKRASAVDEVSTLIRPCEELDKAYGAIKALEHLFGSHNLTAGEQQKPRFSIKDKVLFNGQTYTIVAIVPHTATFEYGLGNDNDSLASLWVFQGDLQPYTAPEAKRDAMELNLCELLKDAEGMEFYSKIFGKCILDSTTAGNHKDKPIRIQSTDGINVWLRSDGKMHRGGELMLFPSAEVRTWDGWQKPSRRWEPTTEDTYWYIGPNIVADFTDWDNVSFDRDNLAANNCFRTKEQASEAAKRVRECLTKFHEEINE